MEIIKSIIEMSLACICVYIGGALYNWGHRDGEKAKMTRLYELEKTNELQRKKIKELHEYIARSYCVNPFGTRPIDEIPHIAQDTEDGLKKCKSINVNHLKSKVKPKEIVVKGKRKK